MEEYKRKIVNCCHHKVSVYAGTVYDPATGTSRGGEEILTVPASGIIASIKSSVKALPPMELNGISIPTCERTFAKVSPLPNNGDLYIVSGVYAQAAQSLGKDVSNLVSPYGKVVDENDNVIGCTGLVRYA